jgi:hypothetical protein
MKGFKMNTLKNMEAIFIVTLALAGSASYLADALPLAKANVAALNAAPDTAAVVVVTGKRMTAEQKQQSLNAERQFAAASANARRSI